MISLQTSNIKTVKKIPSIALDIMRLCAALTVMLIHAKDMWYPANRHNPDSPGEYSHAAVVVFFILSGYVISFSTDNKNRGRLQYAKARLSRLYSVLLPGLVITLICAFFVARLDLPLYESSSRGEAFPRYVITAAFLNEIWFYSAAPPINVPLWSLSYEFWYYVIFGCWFFKGSGWKGLLLSVIACLIAGPKILLMMPIWLAGVFVYRAPRPRLNPAAAWLFAIVVLIVAGLSLSFSPPFPAEIGAVPLFFSAQFLTDYILAFILAIFLWLLPTDNSAAPGTASKGLTIFREVADLTFPIYVLHYPLLILYRAVFGFKENNLSQFISAVALVFIFSAIIGFGLNKWRRYWTSLFGYFLSYLKGTKDSISSRFSIEKQ
jgi:peptidoglycan/LPS O-acetylase OafA/YrhL